MSGRCRWVKEASCPGGKFFLPGCMGGAVWGKSGCTCPPPNVARDKREMLDRMDTIEHRMDRLEELVKGKR